MQPSRFVGWIQEHIDEILVNAEWLKAHSPGSGGGPLPPL